MTPPQTAATYLVDYVIGEHAQLSCLIEAPDAAAVQRWHTEHGLPCPALPRPSHHLRHRLVAAERTLIAALSHVRNSQQLRDRLRAEWPGGSPERA